MWEGVDTLIVAVAALLTAAAGTVKTGWETRRIRKELEPNHGSSTRDSVDRTEAIVSEIMTIAARHDKELGRANDRLLLLNKELTDGLRQARDADSEDRETAAREHRRLHARIARLEKEKP